MIRTAEGDLHIWQWLENLIEYLGSNGMSSEDTDISIDRKYRVKILLWRRNMDQYLKLIDKQRYGPDSGFAPAGSKPIQRVRNLPTPPSTRAAPTGLPETLYDQRWLASTDTNYREITLSVSRENFQWLMFHSEQTG